MEQSLSANAEFHAQRVIREVVCGPYNNRFILREDNYDDRLDKFNALFELARQDFPHLSPNFVDVKHYGGDSHKRQWGIEFAMHDKFGVPAGYTQINEVLPTL